MILQMVNVVVVRLRMMPFISVVIPLYNKEEYIVRTIQSVLGQTYSNFELIVVDDGSTDDSKSIVSSIADTRVRLVSQKNSGSAAARNTGIRHSTGDIVAFLDADDQWMPTFLEEIVELSKKYPNVGIYGTAYSVYSENTLLRDNVWNAELGNRILSSYYAETALCGFPIFITSSFAAPRSVLERVDGYQEDYRSGQDHDLFGRIALRYPIAYSPKICSRYNAGSANNYDRVTYAREIPLERYFLSLPQSEREVYLRDTDIQSYFDFYYLKIGGINVYGGFRKEGRMQLKKISNTDTNRLKRYMFIVLSYLPFSISWISPKLVRTVANKLKLAT